jgi:hypothetical protein
MMEVKMTAGSSHFDRFMVDCEAVKYIEGGFDPVIKVFLTPISTV